MASKPAEAIGGDKINRAVRRLSEASIKANPDTRRQTFLAFCVFFASHIFATVYSPIQDCDEVFNYLEPTHYLNHGYGLQTWEYSPEYALRSWTYAGLHAAVVKAGSQLPFVRPKLAEFYVLRAALAFACAFCEARLFAAIRRGMSGRIALIFLVIMSTSTGMFHASVAYLPSSFAMYCTTLAFAAFMDPRRNRVASRSRGIFWFGVGGVLGWPFALAMALPFVFEEIVDAVSTGDYVGSFKTLTIGSLQAATVLVAELAIDSLFYRKFAPVPLNIVLYNVFSGPGRGPDIYGTEPWHFYARNLFLNFNVWFLLASVSLPLLLVQRFIFRQPAAKQAFRRTLVGQLPFYLWLVIMTLQPHKEERFMYPLYPALALNAALSVHIVLAHVGHPSPGSLTWRVPPWLKFLVAVAFGLAAMGLGLLRTAGIAIYNAPLDVYSPLHEPGVANPGDTVCLGKEWYRFPSSYFLPDGVRGKFVKSEFRGLLPGEFLEGSNDSGLFAGASSIPPGMNDQNKEDLGKYVSLSSEYESTRTDTQKTDVRKCSFMVDAHLPSTTPTKLEPAYITDAATWERLKCVPFLDGASTNLLARLIWVPEWRVIPSKYRRQWGEYCLLRRVAR